MGEPGKRPTGLTIVAWLWIAMGALMVFSGAMAGVAYSMMRQMGPPPPMPPETPIAFVLMFQFFGVMIAVQMVVAMLAIGAGIGLLYMKRWARTALEVLSWLALAYVIGFGIFWIHSWISMTADIPKGADAAPFDSGMFQIMGVVMGSVVLLVFGVPFGFMIRYLRGAEARAAVSSPTH